MTCARTISVAAATLIVSCASAAGLRELRPVDDSYSASQRYYAYKEQYPQLQWPVLEFQAGQRILFDRRYKKIGERELHIDVFLPDAARAAHRAILLVHGGGWRSGNKSNFYSMANLLSQRGYAVFIPEIRLSPEAGYPAGLIDISDAIVWAKEQAGAFDFDAKQIAIGGESTGGHMAALVAYTADRKLFKTRATDETRVSAFVDLDGILDLTTPLALKYENAAGSASLAAIWLGGSMEQSTDRWREASPARYAGAQSPPTLIFTSGEPRFTAGQEEIVPALREHDIRCEVVTFDGTPHAFWLFDPYLGQIVDKMDSFLRAGK